VLLLQLYFCNPAALGMWQGSKFPDKAPRFDDFTKEGPDSPRDPGMYGDLITPEHQAKNRSKTDQVINFK